jgi:hypothetical protein
MRALATVCLLLGLASPVAGSSEEIAPQEGPRVVDPFEVRPPELRHLRPDRRCYVIRAFQSGLTCYPDGPASKHALACHNMPKPSGGTEPIACELLPEELLFSP